MASASAESSNSSSIPAGSSALFTFLPAECQTVRACCCLPAFRLPWSSSAPPPPVTDGASFSSSAALQRLREASHLTWNARIAWVVIHGTFIGALFICDTSLSLAYKGGDYWYMGFYSMVVLLTVIQYYGTSGSSPGYVQEIQECARQEYAEEDLESQTTTTQTLQQDDPKVEASSTSSLSLFQSPADDLSPSASATSLSDMDSAEQKASDPPRKPSGHSKWHETKRQIIRSNSELLRRTDSNRRCPYCNVWQPMRTKHCHDCDKCVLRFDHHCFWVGTCVGQRNHRRFWWYLFFESLLSCWTFVISLSAFAWENRIDLWIVHNFLAFFLVFPLFALSAFLVVLLGFHTWVSFPKLVVVNQGIFFA